MLFRMIAAFLGHIPVLLLIIPVMSKGLFLCMTTDEN